MGRMAEGPSRREFLRGCARGALLAGLTLVGGTLILRRGDENGDGESCTRGAPCGNCPALAGCGMPRARRERREALKREASKATTAGRKESHGR